MNQALVQDVVSEVMRRLGNRAPGGNGASAPSSSHGRTGVRAGEDAPANEPERRSTYKHPHGADVPVGEFGFGFVSQTLDRMLDDEEPVVGELECGNQQAATSSVEEHRPFHGVKDTVRGGSVTTTAVTAIAGTTTSHG